MSVRAPTMPLLRAGRMQAVACVLARRYTVASSFLAGYLAVTVAGSLLSPPARSAFAAWASTSVANLEHHPAGSLAVSAFIAEGSAYAWPALIALAAFGANRGLGNGRTAVVCAAGHVIGTLVSEGIVAYRVDQGMLPTSYRHILDVGPSYVVVSAIVVALVFGSRPARAAAALDLAVLVFAGRIFSGLGHLDVAAVGHLTALLVAASGAMLIRARRARRVRRKPGSGGPARGGAGQDAAA
ncbi:MAG TPA: rhomboid-like protein, partial [Streptosporangiaceae bacterium]|nr:rhomboid-like protein [Streptosporangiaceae bacterium]